MVLAGGVAVAEGVRGEDRREIAVGETGVGGGVTERPIKADLAVEAARSTAWAILVLIRDVPAEAASTSHSRAPSPNAKNSASAALVGFGRRASGPAGRGG